jgi:hypothetical protein
VITRGAAMVRTFEGAGLSKGRVSVIGGHERMMN